ncbi:class I SAM-dependent methyltransferase [Streptomyces caniscabiei]|uniref:class I SAM-dependent methyltransferase n=1 Tax=Streptomyces caniscabiei TaxID=2746961 RepID=UPI0038D5180C
MFWVTVGVVLLFGATVFRGAPYVPSKKRDLTRAFDDLYVLSAKDIVVDIGSGDGIVLREASRRGAKAVGYELNPVLVAVSRWLSRHDDRVAVHLADFWHVSLPNNTTVVYTFGESRDIEKMARKVADEAARLERRLYFISYGFRLRDQESIRTIGAHHLYQFDPLQPVKA